MNVKNLSDQGKLTRETATRIKPKLSKISLTPKKGIKANTVKKVPKILPIVFTLLKPPDVTPTFKILSVEIRSEKGEIIPKRIVGAANNKVEARTGPYLSPNPDSKTTSKIIGLDNGIKIINIPEIRKIKDKTL
jgi:hypothetical protein